MKVSQSYEIEKSIVTGTLVSAPAAVDLTTVGGYLRSVYFATDDTNAFGNVYYRILCRGVPIFPGNTAAPINANVPSGWAAAPARAWHDLNLFLPNNTIRVEFVNYHSAAIKIYLLATVQLDSGLNLLEKISEKGEENELKPAGKIK